MHSFFESVKRKEAKFERGAFTMQLLMLWSHKF